MTEKQIFNIIEVIKNYMLKVYKSASLKENQYYVLGIESYTVVQVRNTISRAYETANGNCSDMFSY